MMIRFSGHLCFIMVGMLGIAGYGDTFTWACVTFYAVTNLVSEGLRD